jgi:predicted lipoprotein with Yx(FWY)xxD motif
MRNSRRLFSGFLALGLLMASVVPNLAQAQSGPPVGLVQHPTLGTIITDRQGLTLYAWEGDMPGVSNCNDPCSGSWPPALLDEAAMMMMMPGMDMAMMAQPHSGLGAIQRADGSWQIAWNGWPLYRFQRDAAPGDANGQGSMGFGSRWAAATVQP